MNDDDEPAMIAFHFKTNFKHHSSGISSVIVTCKRGPNKWDEVQEIENTWIDDDGKRFGIKMLVDVTNNDFFLLSLFNHPANFYSLPNKTYI